MVPVPGHDHIFYGHLLTRVHNAPVPKIIVSETWASVLLLLCLVMLVIIRVGAPARLINVMQYAFSFQGFVGAEREESNQYRPFMFALSFFFMVNLAFLVYKINGSFGFVLKETGHFQQFLIFFLFVIAAFALRRVADFLLAAITGSIRIVEEYGTGINTLNQASGIFIFPWLVLCQFSNLNPLIFISGGLITLSVALIVRWYRGLLLGVSKNEIGLLQIFSYFCGLEILPITVLVKLVVENF